MRSTKLQVIAPPSQNSAFTRSHLTQKVDTKNGGYFGARKGSQEFYLFSGLCVLDLLNNSSNYKTNIICDELYCNCRAYCEQNALKQGILARAKCTPLCHFCNQFQCTKDSQKYSYAHKDFSISRLFRQVQHLL